VAAAKRALTRSHGPFVGRLRRAEDETYRAAMAAAFEGKRHVGVHTPPFNGHQDQSFTTKGAKDTKDSEKSLTTKDTKETQAKPYREGHKGRKEGF
jgi:hypothetical protein